MIEELKEDKLIEKVRGRFRLSSLIRQRLVVLNGGSAPYVDVPEGTPFLEVVVQEILQDKIFLNMDGVMETAPVEEFDPFESSESAPSAIGPSDL